MLGVCVSENSRGTQILQFNKTIIPLVLVGYEIVKANSYPTRAHGMIVK